MKKKHLLVLLFPFVLTGCNSNFITNLFKGDSLVGPQGEQGDTGLQGEQGDQGPQGIQGDKGKTGPAGLSGPRGEQGDPGEKGSLGPQGDQGPQGEQGDKGPTGDDGSDATVEISEDKTWIVNGVNTNQTVVGPQGDPGTTGPSGSGGSKGDQGNATAPNPKVNFVHTQGGFVNTKVANVEVGKEVEFSITPYEGYFTYGYEINAVQVPFEGDPITDTKTFKATMVDGGLNVRGLFRKIVVTRTEIIDFKHPSFEKRNFPYYWTTQYGLEFQLMYEPTLSDKGLTLSNLDSDSGLGGSFAPGLPGEQTKTLDPNSSLYVTNNGIHYSTSLRRVEYNMYVLEFDDNGRLAFDGASIKLMLNGNGLNHLKLKSDNCSVNKTELQTFGIDYTYHEYWEYVSPSISCTSSKVILDSIVLYYGIQDEAFY